MPAISDSFYTDENLSITSIDSCVEEEGIEGFCLDQLRDEIQTGNKRLSTAHINVNGILTRNKLTEIKILLDKTKIDCLGITETKLNKNDSDESLKIEGYKIIRKDRTRNNGGGCLLYYKQHLKVINVEYDDNYNIEAVWVDITSQSQSLLLGVIHRPPEANDFYESFGVCLEALWTRRKNLIIMGDLNSDLRERQDQSLSQNGKLLKTLMVRFGLKNMIKQSTRVTQNTETLIDVILTSDEKKISKDGVFDTGIADHSLVYAKVDLRMINAPPRYQKVSNTAKCNWATFNDELQLVPRPT